MSRPRRCLLAGVAFGFLVAIVPVASLDSFAHAAAAPEPLPQGWTAERMPAGAGAFAVQLATRSDTLLATWLEPLPNGAHRVRFARFAGTGSGAWSAPVTVRESDRIFANWADTPGAAAAADGSIYVWWLEMSAAAKYAYDVHLARSAGGASDLFKELGIVHEDRSPVEHGFVSAVPEGEGIRLFFLDGRATTKEGPTELRTALVTGERIGASALVDDRVCDCCATSAALAGGRAVAAFRDRAEGEIRDIRVARMEGAGKAGAVASSVLVGDDRWRIEGCPVNGPALAAGSARGGNGSGGEGEREIAVAWFSAPGDRPRVSAAISSDGGRNFGPELRLDATKPLGRVAIAPLDAGYAVAWLTRSGDAAELRLGRLAPGGAPLASVTLARTSAGRDAGMPRLVRAGDRIWLAWRAPGPGGLRLAWTPASALPGPAPN
jgi:hypothetical protein